MTQLTKTPPSGQFSLRSLFVAMTLAAVFFAIVGPTVGNSSAKNKIFVFVALGGALTGFLVVLVIFGLLNCRAARRGGQVHFRLMALSMGSSRRMLWIGVAALFSFAMLLLLTFQMATLDPRIWEAKIFLTYCFDGFWVGACFAVAVGSLLYRQDRLELRENGLVQAWIFIPWNRVTEYRWWGFHADRLVFKTLSTVRRATVSEDQIPAVNDFLARYAPR